MRDRKKAPLCFKTQRRFLRGSTLFEIIQHYLQLASHNGRVPLIFTTIQHETQRCISKELLQPLSAGVIVSAKRSDPFTSPLQRSRLLMLLYYISRKM